MVVVIMGVAGAGKTTVGRALAAGLGWEFHDADALHDSAAIARMAAGVPLTDTERGPWLARVRGVIEEALAAGRDVVVACSALREQYRQELLAGHPEVFVAFLAAGRTLLHERLEHRVGHFAGPALLDSQLAALEPPSDVLTLDAALPVETLVAQIRASLPRRG